MNSGGTNPASQRFSVCNKYIGCHRKPEFSSLETSQAAIKWILSKCQTMRQNNTESKKIVDFQGNYEKSMHMLPLVWCVLAILSAIYWHIDFLNLNGNHSLLLAKSLKCFSLLLIVLWLHNRTYPEVSELFWKIGWFKYSNCNKAIILGLFFL